MTKFHKMWVEQCEAAQRIKEEFGVKKALGYLIGEKLVNFVLATDQNSEFAEELPKFVAEVKHIFQPEEIREYLESVQHLGAPAHVLADNEYETLRAAGAITEDVVSAAADIITVEHLKELLLG